MTQDFALGLLLWTLWTFHLNLAEEKKILEDITTIYKLGESYQDKSSIPVEIRARTNAQGLLPWTEFGYLEPENTKDELSCWYSAASYRNRKCNWTTSGFDLIVAKDSIDGKILNSNFTGEVRVQMCRDDRDDQYISNYYHHYQYRSHHEDEGRSCEIRILPSGGQREDKMFYKVETISRCRTCEIAGYLKLCSLPKTPSHLLPPSSPLESYECTTVSTFNLGSITAPIMWIGTKEGRIKVWSGEEKKILKASEILYPVYSTDLLKFIETSHSPDLDAPVVQNFQVLKSMPRLQDCSLTSPKVIAPDSDLCLRVVFHVPSTLQPEDVLSLSVVDSMNSQHHLTTIRTETGGWQSWKVEKTLPKYIQGKLINVVLKTLTNSTVTVLRIGSCNSEDKEDVSVITRSMITNLKKKEEWKLTVNDGKSYFAFHEPKQVSSTSNDNTEMCDNGGVLTDVGCACPAGFSGPNCTTACGFNRYGQDCGGKCSLYSSGCRGLLMCTPGAGCHCAPGFTGESCEDGCAENSYGADCSQKCGHCQSSCDKFTGVCSRCKQGYRPPYCKHKSAYLKTAPEVVSDEYKTLTVSVNITKDNIGGSGEPIFYQVQYRAKGTNNWRVHTTQYMPKNGTVAELKMEDLEDVKKYFIRVILLVDDFNNYEWDDVPTMECHTKCDIPASYDYDINVSKILKYGGPYTTYNKEMDFNWKYVTQKHWCPVEDYEVWWKEGWEWKKMSTQSSHFPLTKLIPSEKVSFKVRARTMGGFAPFSETVKTSGLYSNRGNDRVKNLKAISVKSNSVEISWDPPLTVDSVLSSNVTYIIRYECVERPSCAGPCSSSGSLNTTDTSLTLAPLLSLAHYKVIVGADLGAETSLDFRTLESGPEEIPNESKKKFLKTNSSATVFWEPVEVCSGFFITYQYQLYMASEPTKLMDTGKTRNTNATFNNLRPTTEYIVRVSVMTTSGWDPTKYLEIPFSTAATVPEQVVGLTVYKRGRSMVGLRWAEPEALYGELESFTVSYSNKGAPTKSLSVTPTRCVPWPELFCHTVEGLKPAKLYNFTVSARNKDVHEDGAEAFVTTQTRENSPSAPQNLTVVNMTSSSLGLQWEHPDMANGVLRSFLISVEETEQFQQDWCCQDYPIIEIPVTQEKRYYQLELTGLHPASSYTVSVSGKTVGFGPSQTMNAATRPPVMAVIPPTVEVAGAEPEDMKWLPQSRLPEANTTEVYAPLVKSQILLVLSNDTGSPEESGIADERLLTLLKQEITTPFYFAAEYNQGDTVTLGSEDEGDSDWGNFYNPSLASHQPYQLAAVQISEYNKVLNVDILLSSEFYGYIPNYIPYLLVL